MSAVEKYFTAEKQESLLFAILGVIALCFALYFLLKLKQPFYQGMAYPLIAVALIQLVVGISVYTRSMKDIARVNLMLDQQDNKIQTEEIPRMNAVMKNFALYRWIEITLIVIGILCYLYFPSGSTLKGVGLGLILQAGIMLSMDYFAERRGQHYRSYLQNL
jgi:hypothetical protein